MVPYLRLQMPHLFRKPPPPDPSAAARERIPHLREQTLAVLEAIIAVGRVEGTSEMNEILRRCDDRPLMDAHDGVEAMITCGLVIPHCKENLDGTRRFAWSASSWATDVLAQEREHRRLAHTKPRERFSALSS
jgi:hypothetical protein